MPKSIEIDRPVLEKKIYKIVNMFLQFRNYLPLKKGGTLYLTKLESPSPKDALCKYLITIGTVFLEKKMFLNRQCIFTIS